MREQRLEQRRDDQRDNGLWPLRGAAAMAWIPWTGGASLVTARPCRWPSRKPVPQQRGWGFRRSGLRCSVPSSTPTTFVSAVAWFLASQADVLEPAGREADAPIEVSAHLLLRAIWPEALRGTTEADGWPRVGPCVGY